MRILQNYYYTDYYKQHASITSYKNKEDRNVYIEADLDKAGIANIIIMDDEGTLTVTDWLRTYEYDITPLAINSTYLDVLALPLNEGNWYVSKT